MSSPDKNGGIIRFLIDNSLLLIGGATIALIWANAAHQNHSTSYQDFIHYDVRSLWGGGDHGDSHSAPSPVDPMPSDVGEPPADAEPSAGSESSDSTASDSTASDSPGMTGDFADDEHTGDGSHSAAEEHAEEHSGGHHNWYNLGFIINDVLMALFFAIAAKEVWESLLPGGALSNPRKAATPLLATLGGILGPVVFYLAGSYATGTQEALAQGWAVPCATDIAFSYLVARFIFGAGHPAIAFLLLLAIADDAAGLMILAVFYPSAPINPYWLGLTVAAMFLAWLLARMKVHTHWAYFLGPGLMCWYSFYSAHIHPALGLVPIIPFLPHAHTDLGIFAREELSRDDTLNEFEHFWKTPVEVILGLFGLANAGVVLSSLGTGTWLVLAGLLLGKPVGITLMTWLAENVLKLQKPAGMDYRHVVTLGMVAGIGFTVALFVSVAAFKIPGATQDSVKMGALLSFGAAPLAIIIGKALGIKPGESLEDSDQVSDPEPDDVPNNHSH